MSGAKDGHRALERIVAACGIDRCGTRPARAAVAPESAAQAQNRPAEGAPSPDRCQSQLAKPQHGGRRTSFARSNRLTWSRLRRLDPGYGHRAEAVMTSTATQLTEALARSGGLGVHAHMQFSRLRLSLKHVGGELPDFLLDFIPIRVVTILENAFRATIKELVDQNDECKRNGAAHITRIQNRYIAEFILSLHAKAFTLGDIVSNTLSCSKIEDIIAGMESVYGANFKVDLADSRERWVEDEGNYGKPFIRDMDTTLARISNLFTIRHILVHELPRTPPYDRRSLADLLDHAQYFTEALTWLVPYRVFGAVPRTQAMMNVLTGCGKSP